MKPRIFKKGTNRDGSSRYILQYIKKGKLRTMALNPSKLVKILDNPNSDEKPKEKRTIKNRELSEPKVNNKQ